MFLTRYFIISPLNRYSLRLEAMLQKEEFQLTLETIEPSIEALQGAIKGVYNLVIETEKQQQCYLTKLFCWSEIGQENARVSMLMAT